MTEIADAALSGRPRASRSIPRGDQANVVDHAGVLLFLFGTLLHVSVISGAFFKYAPQAGMAIEAALPLLYGAIAITRRNFLVLPLVLASYLIILAQVYIFSSFFNQDMNLNVAVGYMGLAGFGVFAATKVSLDRILFYTFVMSMLYLLIYTAMYSTLSAGDATSSNYILGADADRNARVVLATSFGGFAIFYPIYHFRRPMMRWTLLTLPVTAVAVYLAHSRFFSAILVVMLPLLASNYLFYRARKYGFYAVMAFFLIFLFLAATNIYNPFTMFQRDMSGYGRFLEFGYAQTLIAEHPLTGSGIPPNQAALASVLFKYDFLSAGDLGIMGIWLQFGVIGVALFIGAVRLCFFPVLDPQASIGARRCLIAMGFLLGIYAIIAPTIWGSSGTMFMSLFVGSWLQHRLQHKAARKSVRIARRKPLHLGHPLPARQ